jgi:uncharacterized protein (DUF433 family)
VATKYAHIEFRDGVPYTTGTATKVRMVVVKHRAFGWDGKELREQVRYPTHGQIYTALSYYYEHQDEIDPDSEAGERMAEGPRP